MMIYLDDERPTPPGWVRCYWPDEVIALLKDKSNNVTDLSLDHDLGNDARGTGYDVLLWIEEQVSTSDYVPPRRIRPHSANSSAVQKMKSAIRQIIKIVEERNSQAGDSEMK
jgi:hypothetical protein